MITNTFNNAYIKRGNFVSERYIYNVILSNDKGTVLYDAYRRYPSAKRALKQLLGKINVAGRITFTYDDDRVLHDLQIRRSDNGF